jgi:hypothetical protein
LCSPKRGNRSTVKAVFVLYVVLIAAGILAAVLVALAEA